jgi:hypothetical protein
MESKADIGIRYAYANGFYVSSKGDLIYPSGRISKTKPNGNGYIAFNVYINKIQHKCFVHRLQAYQKYGNRIFDPNICVRHLNGNPIDNSSINIEIGTQSENMMDKSQEVRVAHATIAASHKRCFSESVIRTIRNLRNSGSTLLTLADRYGTSKGHISDIVNKKLYKNIE